MGSYQRLIWSKILILGLLNAGAGTASADALNSWGTATAFNSSNTTPSEAQFFNFTLFSNTNQTFDTLMQQAESLATKSIEQGFAETSVQEVVVTITGERNGQEVPLLLSKVSRSSWQTEPRIQRWTTYFGRAAVLLGFLKPQVASTSPLTSAQPRIKPNSERIDD